MKITTGYSLSQCTKSGWPTAIHLYPQFTVLYFKFEYQLAILYDQFVILQKLVLAYFLSDVAGVQQT